MASSRSEHADTTGRSLSEAKPRIARLGVGRACSTGDWRHAETDSFGSVIAEKTRQFVGRCKEVAEIKQWMERNDCGFCLIRGNPWRRQDRAHVGAESDRV